MRWAIRGAAERVFGCLMITEPGVRLAEGRRRKSLNRVLWSGLSVLRIPEYGDVCGYLENICLGKPMAFLR